MADATRADATREGGGKSDHMLQKEVAEQAMRIASSSVVVEKLAQLEAGLREKDHEAIPWIKTGNADGFFGAVILGNALFIGVDLEFAPDDFSWTFWTCETVFLLIFLIELAMRISCECPTPWRFFVSPRLPFWKGGTGILPCGPEWWGIFDFTVTLIGCADCWIMVPIATVSSSDEESPMSSFTVLRVFRLVRLARLIKVLRMFNELVILVQTLTNSMRAVGWMSLLLGIIMYTGSIVCVIVLDGPNSENDDIRYYFGTLGDALFSHFCVVTLENWPNIARAAMNQSPLWAFYFVGMITLTNFALVNLMVGVIVERIIHFSMEQENELSAFVAESEQFRITLNALFTESDVDKNGEVTKEEIRDLMEDQRTHEIMNAFGINLDIPTETLFTIMGLLDDGPTTFEAFYASCIRLCGSKQSGIHSIFVQHDVCQARSELAGKLKDIEEFIILQAQTKKLKGGPITTDPLTGESQQESPEECVTELLERMERFGQVQFQICAEIEALKECGRGRSAIDATSLRGGPMSTKVPRAAEVPSCADMILGRRNSISSRQNSRQDPVKISSRQNSKDKSLTKQTREDLEAEFQERKRR